MYEQQSSQLHILYCIWSYSVLYVLCIAFGYINRPTRCTFLVCIYSKTFLHTLHVSNDHFVHYQELTNLLYLQPCTNRTNVHTYIHNKKVQIVGLFM